MTSFLEAWEFLPSTRSLLTRQGYFGSIRDVRTVIEVGGQDSKFIKIEPPAEGPTPRVSVFRMNEVCAAGTGAFLDEQADRLGISVESFGALALQSDKPAPIAGRCAVFAKTDMIHQAQEGTPVPDILLGLAFALVRNYIATLIRGRVPGTPGSATGRGDEQPGSGQGLSGTPRDPDRPDYQALPL